MKIKRRTEITVETHRLLVFQRQDLEEIWCKHCCKRTRKISAQEATEAGLSSEMISHLVDAEFIGQAKDAFAMPYYELGSREPRTFQRS